MLMSASPGQGGAGEVGGARSELRGHRLTIGKFCSSDNAALTFLVVLTRARGASGAMPTDLLDRREPPRRQMVLSTSGPSAISF
jgi:hypothetical protein